MAKLFGIDIAKEVADAIKGAGGVLDATLIVVTAGERSASDPTAGVEEKDRGIRCKGFVDVYRESQIDGTRIQMGDRKVVLLGKTIANGTVAPKPNDRITIEGQTMKIVQDGVTRDPASATYACQVRV